MPPFFNRLKRLYNHFSDEIHERWLMHKMMREPERKPTPRTRQELDDALYGDPSPEEERLTREWMRVRARHYDRKEIEQTQMLLAWAKKASPADWHRCAITFNWDYRADVLRWIAAQPDCDRGTAIHLFHHQRPWFYLNYAGGMETFWRYYVGDRPPELCGAQSTTPVESTWVSLWAPHNHSPATTRARTSSTPGRPASAGSKGVSE
jgi:hypothetical protein